MYLKPTVVVALLFAWPAAQAAAYPECRDAAIAKSVWEQNSPRLRAATDSVSRAVLAYEEAERLAELELVRVRKRGAGEVEMLQKREMLHNGSPSGAGVPTLLKRLDNEIGARLLLLEKITILVEDHAVRDRVGCEVSKEVGDFLKRASEEIESGTKALVVETSYLRAANDDVARQEGGPKRPRN